MQHVLGDSVPPVRAFFFFCPQYFLLCSWPYPCILCVYRWCSFSAYIYEGIERGCGLYCEGYVNPRGYEQKQFVRYGTGFVPVRYDINPGYLAHG